MNQLIVSKWKNDVPVEIGVCVEMVYNQTPMRQSSKDSADVFCKEKKRKLEIKHLSSEKYTNAYKNTRR